MIKFILSFLLPLQIFAFTSIQGNEENIELFKLLKGKFENSRGAEVEVDFKFKEANSEQPSLFGPEYFSMSIDFEENSSGFYFSLDEDDFDGVEDNGTIVFSEYKYDCDNPGCTNVEAYFSFIKKNDGSYYLEVKASFSTDAEDLSWELSEDQEFLDMNDKEKEAFADAACKDYYGETAFLDYLYQSWDDVSVTCGYELTAFLKKVN